MKHTEIEAIFTAKINEFITNGYTINAATMSGSQGEVAKIDFRKGNEVYRVLLEQTHEYTNDGAREVAIITVGRSTENVIRDDRPFDTMGPTFWNNRMEIIEQRKFYQIDRRADYYIEDVEAYDAMCEKQYQRYEKYDQLARTGAADELTDDEAADMIAKEFGFVRESISIIRWAPVYEINRHGRLRQVGQKVRRPRFAAWDWNYIRFNVTANVARAYEMVDGELKPFWD